MYGLEPPLERDDRPAGYWRAGLVFSLLTCFALHASTGAAQTVAATTGAINGAVTDSTRAVLPDVTVVLTSVALMGTRTTKTNGDGLFRFPALAPGQYTLEVTRDGFNAVRREGIYVSVGFTATVNVELHIATLQERVIVDDAASGRLTHEIAHPGDEFTARLHWFATRESNGQFEYRDGVTGLVRGVRPHRVQACPRVGADDDDPWARDFQEHGGVRDIAARHDAVTSLPQYFGDVGEHIDGIVHAENVVTERRSGVRSSGLRIERGDRLVLTAVHVEDTG